MTKKTAENPEQEVRFFWKVTSVEVGYAIQTTIYRVLDENTKKATWTFESAYKIQVKKNDYQDGNKIGVGVEWEMIRVK